MLHLLKTPLKLNSNLNVILISTSEFLAAVHIWRNPKFFSRHAPL